MGILEDLRNRVQQVNDEMQKQSHRPGAGEYILGGSAETPGRGNEVTWSK